jgi:hypothetical protein
VRLTGSDDAINLLKTQRWKRKRETVEQQQSRIGAYRKYIDKEGKEKHTHEEKKEREQEQVKEQEMKKSN